MNDYNPQSITAESMQNPQQKNEQAQDRDNRTVEKDTETDDTVEEIGGYQGPEPTRYGDWEKKGRCVDF